MIVSICSNEDSLAGAVDLRFGRCHYFLIVDSENETLVKAVKNEARDAAGGAGSQAVQQLVENNVEQVIVPQLGPQAIAALNQLSIPAYQQKENSTCLQALKDWKGGELVHIEGATNKGLHRA